MFTLEYESGRFNWSSFAHPLALQIQTDPRTEEFLYRLVEVTPNGVLCLAPLVRAEAGAHPRSFNLYLCVGDQKTLRESSQEAYSRDFEEFTERVQALAAESLQKSLRQNDCFDGKDISTIEVSRLQALVSNHMQSWSRSTAADHFMPFG